MAGALPGRAPRRGAAAQRRAAVSWSWRPLVFLLPVYLFDHELIAPEGKPITAPALGRLLVLGYELVVWGTCVRLLRGCSPLLGMALASAAVAPC